MQRVSRCELRYLGCSCLCQQRGLIPKSSLLPCPGPGSLCHRSSVPLLSPAEEAGADSPRRLLAPAHGATSPGDCLPLCPLVWSSPRTWEMGTGGGVCVAGDVAGGSGVCSSAWQCPVSARGWCQSSRGASLSLENTLRPWLGSGCGLLRSLQSSGGVPGGFVPLDSVWPHGSVWEGALCRLPVPSC